jgi:hypothetical protein
VAGAVVVVAGGLIAARMLRRDPTGACVGP